MAETTLTPAQTQQIKSQRQSGKNYVSYLNHRHPKSAKASRWSMGRVESNQSLVWWVNPSECQWKMGTRTTIEKIGGGVVHHEWPQTGMRGSNSSFTGSRLDQPILSITFQSGIITQGGYSDIGDTLSTSIPKGLGNFFDFLDLLDQPDITSTGEPNYINILYFSPVFGARGLWLQGFFTEEGVSWTDSAENPNMISSWGASFMVFNSQPNFSLLKKYFELIIQ